MGRVSSGNILKTATSEENKAEVVELLSRSLKSTGFNVTNNYGELKITGGCGFIANFEGSVSLVPTNKGDGFNVEMSGDTSPSAACWVLIAIGAIGLLMAGAGAILLIIAFVMFSKARKKPVEMFEDVCEKVSRQLR